MVKILVWATPLYHSVELTRAITTGLVGWGGLVSPGHLIAVTAGALRLASRRTARTLCR